VEEGGQKTNGEKREGCEDLTLPYRRQENPKSDNRIPKFRATPIPGPSPTDVEEGRHNSPPLF
jgi:hypothetical protein